MKHVIIVEEPTWSSYAMYILKSEMGILLTSDKKKVHGFVQFLSSERDS